MPKDDGWVKLHRKILKTELTASQFKFFVGSILLAKIPKSKDSGLVDLSIRKLASELNMSPAEVWRREQELAAMDMISVLPKGFIIRNYNYYQTGKGVSYTEHLGNSAVSPAEQSVSPAEQSVSPAEQSVSFRETTAPHKKDKKDKKGRTLPKKENYFFDNILLSEEEYKKLMERFGEDGTKDRLENLSLYKKSKGRRYASDYATILAWDKKDKKGGRNGAHRGSSRQLKPRSQYTKPKDYRG